MPGAGTMSALDVVGKSNPFLGNAPTTCTFTVGTELADAITVTGQLKSRSGRVLSSRRAVKWYLSSSSTGAALSSAPSGGIAIGATGGPLIEDVTDVSGFVTTNATGAFSVVVTDSGTSSIYLVIVLPDGTLSIATLPFA
jgi:hypothetical protein